MDFQADEIANCGKSETLLVLSNCLLWVHRFKKPCYSFHYRCCRTYEEVHEGDIGKVVKLDLDGLHDLNVQVEWQRKGVLYWVRYIHIELLHRSIHAVGAGGGYTNAGTSTITQLVFSQ